MGFLDILFSTRQILDYAHVGSRVTCNPAPTDTDDDYLVLVRNHESFQNLLTQEGFILGYEDYGGSLDSSFYSYRKGEINLIVTTDDVFFKKFLLGTKIATMLNLSRKEERIDLFQSILYRWTFKL